VSTAQQDDPCDGAARGADADDVSRRLGGLGVWTRTTDNTIRFCERWLAKASQYDDRSLDGAFDKFFSLFIAFNRLYWHLAFHAGLAYGHDTEQATSGFAVTVGVAKLAAALDADRTHDDVRTLADLIAPGGGFYVASRRGIENVHRNQALYRRLISRDSWERVVGLLEYLYFVRCNMFHGHKDLDDAQLRIIRPSARCLERVVLVALEKLRAEAG